jgi:uncharacterized protein
MPVRNTTSVMYANGQGVPQDWVVAYALFDISSADTTTLGAKGKGIAATKMTLKQIEAGKRLTAEITKPNNLSKAIAEYLKNL